MWKRWGMAALVAAVLTSPAWAEEPFDAAVQAYNRGDYAAARGLWEQALAAGDWAAARSLGTLYRRGLGLPPDATRASAYYREAVDHGVVLAEPNLAEMLIAGQGVARDVAAAKALLAHAADKGSLTAQFRLDEIEEAESRGEAIPLLPPSLTAPAHSLMPMPAAPPPEPPREDATAHIVAAPPPAFTAPGHALVAILPSEAAAAEAWLGYNLPGLEPVLDTVQPPGGARMVRLWAAGAPEILAALCGQMAERGEQCRSVAGVPPSSVEAAPPPHDAPLPPAGTAPPH